MTREEIVKLGNEAIEKAKNDPEFKKKLISDGNKAVLELIGKELPIKFTVHDTDAKHLVFILPEVLSSELEESDLSGVSGGNNINVASRVHFAQCGYAIYPTNSLFNNWKSNSNGNNL